MSEALRLQHKYKASMPDWPRILRREGAAQYLGISPSILDREVASGSLPKPIPITGCIRGWVRDDLDAWIDDRRNGQNTLNEWD
ncbi:AlpA family phage regulatory protein [Acetobacter orientalis]|uniref:helix-turn-helix transcriptional regulator n=1 Tax=Acetobacter orientalis TaxID=146474 RepID=UPI0020A5933E|nr:AlpA family phage regulatory protein [Acetobacter orientalis]MCP1221360.1 AlpA family phage regulatory protein [Acetobacter orientalis]